MNLTFADIAHHTLKPLTWTRSVIDIEVGGATLGKHAVSRLPMSAPISVFVPKYLAEITTFNEDIYELERQVTSTIQEGTVVWSPAILPEEPVEEELKSLSQGEALINENTIVAVVLDRSVETISELLELAESYSQFNLKADAKRIRFPWDLDRTNASLIRTRFDSQSNDPPRFSSDVEIIGDRSNISLGSNVDVAPGVTFDTREGPIIIGKESSIDAKSRLEGPLYIGDWSKIGAGQTAVVHGNTHIGNVSRTGGEVGNLILHSFSNKYHYGFLGHSIIGSWVNIGAGTTNSDLKNTYGEVVVTHPTEGRQPSGTKVGTTIGDHTKTGIQTAIHTGKVVGPCCNLIGRVNNDVSPFTWQDSTGTDSEEYAVNEAVIHTNRMIERREEHLPEEYADAQRKLVRDLYSLTDESEEVN